MTQHEDATEEEEDSEHSLELTDQDRRALEIAGDLARELLTSDMYFATPQVIAGVGYLLYALGKFPAVPSGLQVWLSVDHRYGGESCGLDIRVSEDAFSISRNSVGNSGWGYDVFDGPAYRVGVDGRVQRSLDIWQVGPYTRELLALGAEVLVTVEGKRFEDIDWEG